jgi:hypothetical protein
MEGRFHRFELFKGRSAVETFTLFLADLFGGEAGDDGKDEVSEEYGSIKEYQLVQDSMCDLSSGFDC